MPGDSGFKPRELLTHHYLHDRLGEVPRAPVAEPCLHCGRNETFVPGSIIRVISGLRGIWKGGGEEKTETELVTSPPNFFVSSRQSIPGDQGTGVRLLRAISPWSPHFCVLVPKEPRLSDRALSLRSEVEHPPGLAEVAWAAESLTLAIGAESAAPRGLCCLVPGPPLPPGQSYT